MTVAQLRRCIKKLDKKRYSKKETELLKEWINEAYQQMVENPPKGSLLYYATSPN